MDVDTGLTFRPRVAGVVFEHCGIEHYHATPPAPDSPLEPEHVTVVCGACPAPRRGLLLRCHVCRQPIRLAQGADGRLYTSIGRRNGDA